MVARALVHREVWDELPRAVHDRVRTAMEQVADADHPGDDSSVERLSGASYRNSFRLRVGPFRVLFIFFPDEDTVVFTTAFRKKRSSDYARATARHDARVRRYE